MSTNVSSSIHLGAKEFDCVSVKRRAGRSDDNDKCPYQSILIKEAQILNANNMIKAGREEQ